MNDTIQPGEDPPALYPARLGGPTAQITAILVGQARMEEKLNSLLEKFIEVDALANQVTDHENRLIKIEAFQGMFLWVLNGGWAVLGIGAFLLAKLGVL